MKTSTLALTTLLTLASAAVPKDAQWYTLSTKSYVSYLSSMPHLTHSSTVNTLSGLYLSSKGGKVGAYPGTRESASSAFKFFTTEYKPASSLSLHPGDDTHQIALSGKGGLMNLVDLAAPSSSTIDPNTPTEWSVFTIGAGGALGVKDGSALTARTFVTYLETDGNYYVGLWDGVTAQPRTVSNVTVVATKTEAPRGKMARRFAA
jgi:hypothetical protein